MPKVTTTPSPKASISSINEKPPLRFISRSALTHDRYGGWRLLVRFLPADRDGDDERRRNGCRHNRRRNDLTVAIRQPRLIRSRRQCSPIAQARTDRIRIEVTERTLPGGLVERRHLRFRAVIREAVRRDRRRSTHREATIVDRRICADSIEHVVGEQHRVGTHERAAVVLQAYHLQAGDPE